MKVRVSKQQLKEVNDQLEFNVNQINVNPKTYVMQMIEDGKIIGEIEFAESRDSDDIAEINGVEIDKQGQGYGMLLYEKLIEYLQNNGYYQVVSDHINMIRHDAVHKIWQNLGAEWEEDGKYYFLDFY